MPSIYKIVTYPVLIIFLFFSFSYAAEDEPDFNTWLTSFKQTALKKGISQNTIDIAFKNVKFLDQVLSNKHDKVIKAILMEFLSKLFVHF